MPSAEFSERHAILHALPYSASIRKCDVPFLFLPEEEESPSRSVPAQLREISLDNRS
jgi:hypothetical protein